MNNQIAQIESLLKHLKHDKEMSPTAAFRTNARIRILNMIASSKAPSPTLHRRPVWMLYAFRFALIFIFLFGSTVYAAQSSSPNDILYPVKTMSEQVALTLSPTESAKTSVATTIISRRASEHASAEKAGDTEEINETSTNFESAVSEMRKTRHIDREKVELEIRKYETPSQEESDVKEGNTDIPESKTEQKEQNSVSTPSPTKKEEQSGHELLPTIPKPTTVESSNQDDHLLDIKGPVELD